jgi:tripartite motif-containing protein 71
VTKKSSHTAIFVAALTVAIVSGTSCQAQAASTYRFEHMWPTAPRVWSFYSPLGVGVAPDGSIYVADTNFHRIQRFNASGQNLNTWGSRGSGNGQFSFPGGIAIGSDGSVYVADTGNHRIQKFTAAGQYVITWGSQGSGDGQFNRPGGIAISSDGSMYVADTFNHRIQRLGTDGQFVSAWGSQGSGNGEFKWPGTLAVDAGNYVYVADGWNHRVQKFNSSGQFVAEWGSLGLGDGQFNWPAGIAIASDGSVYVADSNNHRLQKFTSSGQFLAILGRFGAGDGQFNFPRGLAIDSGGSLWVADSMNHRIQNLTASGQFASRWSGQSSADGEFFSPVNTAIGPDGSVYVADAENHRIQKFTTSGQFVTKWGTRGSTDGKLNRPYAIAVGADNDVYVADTWNHRVQKFTSAGQFVAKWGTSGTDDGQFNSLDGIAVGPDGSIYVTDAYNHHVQKFTSSGQYVAKWGSYGSGDGQFNFPQGIAVDANGYAYVADTNNNRIQKFTSGGQYVAKWGSSGSGYGQVSYPYGIGVSAHGSIYVADTSNDRIQEFTPSGQFVAKWGSTGFESGYFAFPRSVACDSAGAVYIADTVNNRIQVFSSGSNTAPVVSQALGTPQSVPSDGDTPTLLTVQVSDADGASDIASVSVDLSPVGGSTDAIMHDDATHGDATAGDGIYSLRTTVSLGTSAGRKSLAAIATDQSGASGSSTIALSVTNQITATVLPNTTNTHTVANQFAGQTLTIEYALAATRLRQACATTLTVKKPDGSVHSTQEIQTQTTTLTIPNAAAGIWTYEVSTACSAPISYSITTSASGTGVITGTVTASGTQEGLSGVEIRTNTGGIALSLSGYYVLVAPAGQCTVTASGYGYKSSSQSGVVVTSGGEVTANLTLEPLGNLYFPHIASNATWDTEIGIINPSATETVIGTLRPFGDSGAAASSTLPVTLAPHGRRQITISQGFTSPDTIGYLLFESDSSSVKGYTKFYRSGLYRAAIPAAAELNSGDIFLTHVTSDPSWWTGVSLLNTTSQARTAGIEFSNGTSINKSIAANEHQKFLVSDLFSGQTPAGIASAVVKNAGGVIGLELFGSTNQLEGIPATDESATTLYYPYVPTDPSWWAGMVAYNPSATACNLTITGYLASGTEEAPLTRTLNGKEKLLALTTALGLSADTAWFKIEATSPITGFELIGTSDWNQVAGFYGIGAKKKEGVFAKIEKGGGWTFLVLTNTEDSQATVTLTAYTDSGTQVATTSFTLNGHAKVEQTAQEFFATQNITTATYIGFTSTKDLVGLQLNGSADETMLDGLAGL